MPYCEYWIVCPFYKRSADVCNKGDYPMTYCGIYADFENAKKKTVTKK